MPPTTAIQIRRDAQRGRAASDWLDARFSFSFGDWHDPDWPRFGPLRAINEDRVQPGTGFAMHPHRDLEILMLPRSGCIEHRDSLGGHALVGPGDLLVLQAGRGIRHSQMNPSPHEVDHHFQIWLATRTPGAPPRVRRSRPQPPADGGWTVLASGLGAGGEAIDADATVRWGRAAAGAPLVLAARPGASRYVHLMSGAVEAAGAVLAAGDALVQRDAGAPLVLHARGAAEALCFELPPVHP